MTPRRLRLSERTARPARWGDRPPIDDDEARRRLLDAAEVCYQRRGVSRTTVDDIAKEAAVHRTTVYRYFGSRDDVLAFVMLRESADVMVGAQRTLDGDGPFGERLLDALDVGMGAVQESRWLRALFSPETMTMTVATAAATAFRERVRAGLRPYVEAAKANEEVRAELNADAVADWLVRVAQMLLMEQLTASPQDGNIDRRSLMRDFVIPGILSRASTGAARRKGRSKVT